MNYLHSRYQKAGKISNDDMLYTLSLFILEVDRWVEMYEWRSLTEMEKCALYVSLLMFQHSTTQTLTHHSGTHWKSIGDAMSISFTPLRHSPSFRNGLEFFHDVKEWSNAYETRTMVPDKHNHQLAEETSRILLTNVPGPLKQYAKQFVVTLMDERLRKAMLYPEPPAIYRKIINVVFTFRRLFTTYLLPPRPYAWRFSPLSDEPDANGRYFVDYYDNQPWYFKATFWTRNSPLAWFRWAIGEPFPDGKQYKPEGYRIMEMGPERMEGKGVQECEATLEDLMKRERGACPFAVGR